MSDILEAVTSLSIARHTVQFILFSALDANPKQCCGLIGQHESTISHAVLLPDIKLVHSAKHIFQNSDLQHTLKHWKEQGVTPCGIFFTTVNGKVPAYSELKKSENFFKKTMAEFTEKPFIHMPLMLNTAGCLEAFSYRLGKDALLSIPLILEEDGQQIKNG